jgi:hypothetical protein
MPEGDHLRKSSHNFLSKAQLEPIMSIRCLHEKQHDPHSPCQPKRDVVYSDAQLGIGHYPHWKDGVCHSDQEFFCDPIGALSAPDQHAASEHLRAFKERTLVNCGQLESVLDPEAKRRWWEKKKPIYTGRLGLEDYREFNLAVMLADEWPREEMDPKSMQYFGRVVMTKWGLMPIYNGVDNGNPVNQYHDSWAEYRSNCPNTAVLFILPKYHEAHLLSPSCEFLCESRGGPEVVAATLAGLDRGGVRDAIMDGVDMVEKLLKASTPLTIMKTPETPAQQYRRLHSGAMMYSDAAFVWALRLIYGFLIFLLLCFGGSFFYFMFVPDTKAGERRGRRLMGEDGREALREAGVFA